MKPKLPLFTILLFVTPFVTSSVSAIPMDRLSTDDIALVQTMLANVKPFIEERREKGDLNMLTYEELYSHLVPQEQLFMNAIRRVKPSPPVKLASDFPSDFFVQVDGQFLPKNVHRAYQKMMEAMQKDLGKRLHVESGYRSPAYQLYLFAFYLGNHDYSIGETNRWVALPGFSEHGDPSRQAIDFINEEGVSGESHPEDFENLPEYQWLTRHARKFGFVLSYPKNNTTNSAFEPWHWRYDPKTAQKM